MRITIITPSFNQGRYIRKNIESVVNQNHNDVEHIVVDGGSTDETVSILRQYDHVKWISEPDKGQSDALNKGLAMATGEVVGWLNADDFYEPDIFASVARNFPNRNVKWVVGRTNMYVDNQEMVVPMKSHKIGYYELLDSPDIVRQQGAFYRRDILSEVGGWNSDLFMVMDFDLWVRISRLYPPKVVNENWAFFTLHSDQKTSLNNARSEIREIHKILRREGAPSNAILKFSFKQWMYLVKGTIKSRLIKVGVVDIRYKHLSFFKGQ